MSGLEWPAAIVFDMDGTLLDSERLARDCFVAACEAVGLDANLEVYHTCIGSTSVTTRQILEAHYGADLSWTALRDAWEARYAQRLAEAPVPMKVGVMELLQLLEQHRVPLAVATSTRREVAEHKLANAGLDHFFETLVCGGEAQHGKPHPAPYLLAVERLGAVPARCWAMEDSSNGVRSAIDAGLHTFQIPDLLPALQANLGHRIVDSLHDVKDLLQEIAKPFTH